MDQVKEKGNYKLPLRNVGFLLYHVAKNDLYVPELFEGFESSYREITSVNMTSRHAMGGMYGHYRSNQGTKYGVDYWEDQLEKNAEGLHV